MSQTLKLQVLLAAVDRVTAPLRNISAAGSKTVGRVKELRDHLKQLNETQRTVDQFDRLKTSSQETAQSLATSTGKLRELSQQIGAARAAVAPLSAAYDEQARKLEGLRAEQRRQKAELQATTAEHATANAEWKRTADRIKAAHAQMAAAAEPTATLRAHYDALVKQQQTNLTTVRALEQRMKALREENRATGGEARKLTTQTATLKRELGEAGKPLKALEREFGTARKAAAKLKETGAGQAAQLQALRSRLAAAGVETGNLSSHQRRLRNDTLAASRALAEEETRLRRINERLRQVQAVKAHYAAGLATRDKIAGAGMATTAAGAATGAAVLAPVKAYAEAEDAAKQLYIAMMRRGGMVAPEFARVTALADALGNRLPGTTADFQNMMTMLIRQGMTAKAVLGGLGEATAYLGVQLKMAPADAAEFAAKMQDATRTTEADMMRLMDAIQRTYYLGVDPSNMLQGFSKVSPALRTLRMEGLKAVNALAPMLVMFDQAGMKGEAGGNALRKVLDLGLDREKREKANAALKASGVGINLDLSDGKGEFGGLDHMFAEFAKLRHLNRETLIAALKTQFGDDAETQQVLSILIDKGRAGYLDTLDRMQAQADLQTRVAEQLGTLRNLWDAATGTMTNTLVRFGEAIAPELKAATEWIGDAAEAVGAFAKEHPVLTNAVMKTVAILAVLLTVMGALTLGLAAMMGPMLVVRAGLGLLGIQFGGTLRLAGSVAGMMGRTLPAVLGKLGGRLGQLAPALAGYWRAADPATAGRSTLQFAKTLRERIPAAAGAAAQSVRRWAGMLSGTAATELTVAEVGVRRYTARVWQAVQAQRAAMAARWTGGRQYLATRGIGGMAADAGRGGLNLAKGLALAPITAATSAMRLLGQVVLFVGRAALMNPIGLGITAIAVAALLVVKYWEPIRAWFGGFWQGLREGLAPIGELFGRAFGVIAPILAPLRPVWDWLLGALADAWNWASQLFEPFHATQQGLEAATASGRGFGRWLGSLITITTELLAAFATLPLRFVEIGVQLMQGLVDGITRALGTVKAAIVNAGDQTIGWFKERLGIHSPSRVFASLGGHTMDGLAIGLDRGSQAPLAAMLALTRQLTQPIVGAVALGTSVAAPAGQVAVDPLAALGRITIDHRPPLAASRPAAAEAGPALVIQELHVHAAPGMDAQQLARLVADEIARQTRATQATRRGRLADGD